MMNKDVAEMSQAYQAEAAEQGVPAGYKQTEVGVTNSSGANLNATSGGPQGGGMDSRRIPEGWEVLKFSELCTLVNGRGFKPHEWSTEGLPIIRIQNLNGSDEFNYYSGQYDPKIFIQNGQLLFAWSGSRGTSFGPHIWNGSDALLNYHTWKLVVKEARVTEDFFFHILKLLTKEIEDSAHGASALVHTQKGEMEKFLVPLPKLKKEQTAIANALSDVDALLSELEKLIAKKQAIKTATMQQLLTGRTRLPQFALHQDGSPKGYKQSELGEVSEDWNHVALGDITICLDNLRVPLNESQRNKMYGDIPYCGANGIVGWVNDFVIDDDIILIAEDGGYFDEFATRPIAYRMKGKCWVNNHAHILQAVELFDQDFIYYSLVHKDIQKYLASGTRAKLNKSEMEKIGLVAPESKKEQTAIATILSDMDADIQTLEHRLNKTRQIKQGMMQQLLTGKIRLLKPVQGGSNAN